ncbi:MAG: hypothetical protein KAY37_08725 [Phycisphaerae bacterium]|nr:hypothetical protein [Phycisphaerae bacterium]
MLDILPKRALFQFELPIHYNAKPPRVDGLVSKWAAKYMAPPLVELEDEEPFADVYWAWNEDGFHAAFDIPNRTSRPQCDPKHWWKKNGVRLCLDTRDARDIKRATRFCHFFYFLPLGGGTSGKLPVAGTHRMSRAKEPPPKVDLSLIKIGSHVDRHGYSLEVAIPAACLHGWDPAEHPRIGVFYKIRDTQFGSQHLSVNDELGWNVDPSTWATGVLVR